MTIGAPDRQNDPDAVEKCQQEAEQAEQGQAEQGGAALHCHDDGGANYQRSSQNSHGQAVGTVVDLLAEMIQALQVEIDPEFTTADFPDQAPNIFRQAGHQVIELVDILPAALPQGSRSKSFANHPGNERLQAADQVKFRVQLAAQALPA